METESLRLLEILISQGSWKKVNFLPRDLPKYETLKALLKKLSVPLLPHFL